MPRGGWSACQTSAVRGHTAERNLGYGLTVVIMLMAGALRCLQFNSPASWRTACSRCAAPPPDVQCAIALATSCQETKSWYVAARRMWACHHVAARRAARLMRRASIDGSLQLSATTDQLRCLVMSNVIIDGGRCVVHQHVACMTIHAHASHHVTGANAAINKC